jgi:hypothetical protein
MPNPYPTTPTNIDIRASAASVVELLKEQHSADKALQLLEQIRARESTRPAVQEALDRYVAADAGAELNALRVAGHSTTASAPTLDRLNAVATQPPRVPVHKEIDPKKPEDKYPPNELEGLTPAQTYDVYASMVRLRGDLAARNDLGQKNHPVILGLRNDKPYSTLDSMSGRGSGTGVYGDRMVVLSTDAQGNRNVHEILSANTEPTAQYDEHVRKFIDHDGKVKLGPSPGYENVKFRKLEGKDTNHDGIRDLARLGTGTYEMRATTHPVETPEGTKIVFAFRPTDSAVAAGHGKVERDTNADGRFDASDPGGKSNLDNSIKIHPGWSDNVRSAGCQTIRFNEYNDFLKAVTGQENPKVSDFKDLRVQYVLADGHFAPPVVAQKQDTAPPQSQNLHNPGPAPVPPPSNGSVVGSADSSQTSQCEKVASLHPDLQRILDAVHTGNQAQINAAFGQIKDNYLRSPEGQVCMRDAENQASRLRLAQERVAAAESKETVPVVSHTMS